MRIYNAGFPIKGAVGILQNNFCVLLVFNLILIALAEYVKFKWIWYIRITVVLLALLFGIRGVVIL